MNGREFLGSGSYKGPVGVWSLEVGEGVGIWRWGKGLGSIGYRIVGSDGYESVRGCKGLGGYGV